MARPKREAGGKPARERLEDAFWTMLAEIPYHVMTCKELRGWAGVSHTSFYYHFRDVDDLARWAFERLAVPEVPAAIMAIVTSGGALEECEKCVPDMELRFSRMRLVAANGSPFLMGLLRKAVIGAWLASTGVTDTNLTEADRANLTFAFGGIISLFGSELSSDPMTMAAFSKGEIAHGVMRAMQGLSKRP